MSVTWDQLNVEYRAKGWPLIDPRSRLYCYQPCETGLHVCGFHPDGNNFLTIDNFPARTASEAEALFERAMEECGLPDSEDGDFVIDLQIDGSCERDFRMNRQMLARLAAMSTPSQTPEE